MPVPDTTPALAWGSALILLVALVFYGAQVVHLWRAGGKVRVDAFDLPELLMSIVFAGFFIMTVFGSQRHGVPEPEVKIEAVLPNSLLFVAFTAGIAGFMRFRGLRLRTLFGLNRLSPWATLGWSVALVLTAIPIAEAGGSLILLLPQMKLEPQPLVDLFSKVSAQHNASALRLIILSAVVLQPVCEEFIFRGFFYGVWKRYLGAWSGGFLACLLFAATHGSLSAFGGLFTLAVCLNIAYERTGSLLVPIVVHAMFNLTSLLVLYGQAQTSAGR